MKIRTLFSIAALAALGATTAYADRGLKDADQSGDGLVSLDEFKAAHNARVEEHFSRMDSNADGFLSDDEIKTAHGTRGGLDRKHGGRHHGRPDPEQVFERLDADGSGTVSFEELQGKRFSPDAAAFQAADSDGSGGLDAEELHAMMMAHRAERRGPDRADSD